MTNKNLDDLTPDNADEAWDYVYNSGNRQTEVKKNSVTEGLYTYNALGNRVKKVAGAVTEELYFDGADCVGERYTVQGESPVTVAYVTPRLDENMVMTRGGTDYCYTQDGLGSVRELINTTQTTQNSYDYEAFGSFYGTPTENVPNRYTYTGREWDAERSLYYYRRRTYCSDTGTFLQADPVAAEVSLYRYVGNLPTLMIDPIGLWGKIVRSSAEFAALARSNPGLAAKIAKEGLVGGKWIPDKKTGKFTLSVGNLTRGVVCSNDPKDRFEDLAKTVRQSPTEISKWLQELGGGPVTYKKPKKGTYYTFPNTYYFVVGDCTLNTKALRALVEPAYQIHLFLHTFMLGDVPTKQEFIYSVAMNWAITEADKASGKGYHTRTRGADKETIEKVLKMRNIYGFWIIGHGGPKKEPRPAPPPELSVFFMGYRETVTDRASYIYPSDVENWVSTGGLGYAVLNTCFSNRRNAFKKAFGLTNIAQIRYAGHDGLFIPYLSKLWKGGLKHWNAK
jgi:RHS repeat-associated protein